MSGLREERKVWWGAHVKGKWKGLVSTEDNTELMLLFSQGVRQDYFPLMDQSTSPLPPPAIEVQSFWVTHIHFKFCIRKILLEIKWVLLKSSFLCIATIFHHFSKPSSNANGIQSCYMKTKSTICQALYKGGEHGFCSFCCWDWKVCQTSK